MALRNKAAQKWCKKMIRNENLIYYSLKDAVYKIHGRTDETQPAVPLFWNAGSIEVNVTGTELWIDIEVDFDLYEPWVGCDINGALISRQMLHAGRYQLCLFRHMNESTTKNVRFFRETQAMSSDSGHHLLIHGFSADGVFLPVPDKKYRLEFIGDSITSGEGTYGARQEMDWVPMFMSASRNYASMISDALNADYRLLSQGGWGVLCSWDNNPHNTLPSCYEKICGLLSGETNEKLGAQKAYNFHSYIPDAVIINLGTNDAGAFNEPAWHDPVTGDSFKQHRNPDGTYCPADLIRFQKAVYDFLALVRKNNPNSFIVWAYGMAGYDLALPIAEAVSSYRKQTKDLKASFLQLPAATYETSGSRNHPGVRSHEQSAKILIDYLKVLLEA